MNPYRKAAIKIHETFAGTLFWVFYKSKESEHDPTCTTCNTIEAIIRNHVTHNDKDT